MRGQVLKLLLKVSSDYFQMQASVFKCFQSIFNFNMPTFEYKTIESFDNIALFSSNNEQVYFPFHFHDFFLCRWLQVELKY
jgi:hypothetical protein